MSERGLELLEKVMALDPEERRALVEELYARVHEEDEDLLQYEQEGVKLAQERLAQLERGEAKLVPMEEALKALRR